MKTLALTKKQYDIVIESLESNITHHWGQIEEGEGGEEWTKYHMQGLKKTMKLLQSLEPERAESMNKYVAEAIPGII
jgi:hypothetical protein